MRPTSRSFRRSFPATVIVAACLVAAAWVVAVSAGTGVPSRPAAGASARSTAPGSRAPHRSSRAAPGAASATHAGGTRVAHGDRAPVLTDTLRLDPLVRAGVLPNGLHYFIRVNHKPEKRVALRLAVNAGATVEDDDQRGLAHLSEHMNFDGSEHFKPDELVAYLESIGLRFGADANAYTSFDETIYMLEVPTDRDTLLDRGVTALSDFAGRATFTDAEIEKERGVVLEEWRLGRGAGERIERQQLPVVFHGSRYAERLPIGLPEIIRHGSPGRLRAFYHDWYTPDRMAVVAVGDFDPDRMEQRIREHFGTLAPPAHPRPTPTFDIPPRAETLVSTAVDSEATGSSVRVLFERHKRPDVTVGDYRRSLEFDLYTEMLNARLDEIAHRADAPFLRASAFRTDLGRTSEAWQLGAGVRDGDLERGLGALLDEAARVRRHGFLPAELARARDEIRSSMERAYAERDRTESGDFAGEYVDYFLTHEPAPGIETEYAITRGLLDGITLDEIDALTARLMSDSGRVVLAVAPAKAGATMPSEAALRAVLAAPRHPQAWVDSTSGRALMASPPAGGTIASRRRVDALDATVLTLSNGVTVWLKPTRFKADEIVFSAFAPGGTSLADSAHYAEAWMTPLVLGDAGVGGYTDTELHKLLAGRIVDVAPSYGLYVHGIDATARPEDFETALQLAYLTFTHPTRDPAAFAALERRLHEAFANRANSPDAVYQDTVSAVNSGGFYMSRVPTAAELDAVSLDRVLAFHYRLFANAADFTFAFAGTFDADSIAPLVARYLGSLPSRGHPTSAYAPIGPRYPNGTRRVDVHKGVEPKSSARLTFFTSGAPIEELDMHRARACATILNDHLRETLRQLLGGTYGASVSFSNLAPLPGYATMSVRFGCDPARLDTLVAVTLDEIRKLRDQGPSDADLEKDQEIERRELEVSLQQNGYWTGSILSCLQLGINPLRITHRRERIDALQRDALRETFRKYFPLDRYTVVSLLPATGIAPASAGAPATTP